MGRETIATGGKQCHVMATVSRRGDRQWQAKVRRKGHVASVTFETKVRAEAWARQIESDIDAGRFHPGRLEAEKVTLAEALGRCTYYCIRAKAVEAN